LVWPICIVKMSFNLHLRLHSKFGFKRVINRRKQKIKTKKMEKNLIGPTSPYSAHQEIIPCGPNPESLAPVSPRWRGGSAVSLPRSLSEGPHWSGRSSSRLVESARFFHRCMLAGRAIVAGPLQCPCHPRIHKAGHEFGAHPFLPRIPLPTSSTAPPSRLFFMSPWGLGPGVLQCPSVGRRVSPGAGESCCGVSDQEAQGGHRNSSSGSRRHRGSASDRGWLSSFSDPGKESFLCIHADISFA
jgi:hypothetical protein